MNQHRPVPKIGRTPQDFSPAAVPSVPHPMMPMPQPILGQSQQPTYEQAISEQMADMAMEIYCRLASSHISSGQLEPEVFRFLAKESQIAARVYFESLGVKFEEDPQS